MLGGAADVTPCVWVSVAMDSSALTALAEGTAVLGNVLKHSPNDTASPEPPTV